MAFRALLATRTGKTIQQCHVAPMNCGGFFVGSIWIDVPPGSG